VNTAEVLNVLSVTTFETILLHKIILD